MQKMKILTVLLATFFSIATLKGQDIMVINNDTEIPWQSIAINDIQQITFADNYMWLKTANNNDKLGFWMDDISSVTFRYEPSAIKDIPKNNE